mgnify:CR=1 FL=1
MSNILGNLIDNAMEASQGEEEPYIDLTIRQEKTFLVIKIINQYSRDFSENLKTTKKEAEVSWNRHQKCKKHCYKI